MTDKIARFLQNLSKMAIFFDDGRLSNNCTKTGFVFFFDGKNRPEHFHFLRWVLRVRYRESLWGLDGDAPPPLDLRGVCTPQPARVVWTNPRASHKKVKVSTFFFCPKSARMWLFLGGGLKISGLKLCAGPKLGHLDRAAVWEGVPHPTPSLRPPHLLSFEAWGGIIGSKHPEGGICEWGGMRNLI